MSIPLVLLLFFLPHLHLALAELLTYASQSREQHHLAYSWVRMHRRLHFLCQLSSAIKYFCWFSFPLDLECMHAYHHSKDEQSKPALLYIKLDQ